MLCIDAPTLSGETCQNNTNPFGIVLKLGWRRFRRNFIAFDQDGRSAGWTIEPGNIANVHFRERHGLSAIRAGDFCSGFWRIVGHEYMMTES